MLHFINRERLIAILVVFVSGCIGAGVTHWWHLSKTPLVVEQVKEVDSSPSALVRQAQAAGASQKDAVEKLLTWITDLRMKHAAVPDTYTHLRQQRAMDPFGPPFLDKQTQTLVYQSFVAFGQARYAPASDLLISELNDPRLEWHNPSRRLVTSQPEGYGDRRPYLLALVQIGPETTQSIIKTYLAHRQWQLTETVPAGLPANEREEVALGLYLRKWAFYEEDIKDALTEKTMISSAIHEVNMLLFAANLLVHRESLDDLDELKKYLLEYSQK